MESLWGEEFVIEDKTKKIIEKIKKPKVVKVLTTEQKLKSKTVPIETKIATIKDEVYKVLGSYANETITIKTYEEYIKYIDRAIENGIIAVDTETNNTLNNIDCKLMGLCIYTPGMKNAYIPVNHTDLEGNKLDWQITEQQIASQLKRLENTKIIFHNAVFDMIVIKTTCDVMLNPYWDTAVASQIINENEHKSLKEQYKLHIDPEQDKYNIEKLFNGLPYAIFDPELFALYAATDAYMTHKLYEYQKNILEKPSNKELYEGLFMGIEMPLLNVIADMKLRGINVDLEYASEMSKIYHAKSDEVQSRIDLELANLQPQITAWRLSTAANEKPLNKAGNPGKSKNEQLADPPELSSPTQMAILLYDILKAPVIDKNSPRGTGADILEALAKDYKICNLLLEKRGVDILINTFIDAIPTFVQKDGRVHASFNTTGTATGRFSSSEPNMQQIPSHDKTIRMIFKASNGYSIIGADYSAQEPRSTASLAKDEDMLRAYHEGKDLYAVIGSKCMHVPYEDCLEFHPVTHALQPEGKKRRSQAKTILLGITYGMGARSLAEKMNLSQEEAEAIIEEFYKGFPGVKKLTDDSQEMLKRLGYVTDMWGRRRHLPDAQLPEYEIIPSGRQNFEFNPLLDSIEHRDERTESLIKMYRSKLEATKWKKDRDTIIAQAKKDGFEVKSNSGFINRALRQCLNARIQGTAASMTKKAMVMIDNDPELNRLGFKLLATIHDEVFGEAPTEVADEAAKRLSEVMVEAAKTKCVCDFKCDPYEDADGWYETENLGNIDDFKVRNSSLSREEALSHLYEKYPMFNREALEKAYDGLYQVGKDSLKHGVNYYKK